MKIGIVGSRRRNLRCDWAKIYREFEQIYQPGDMIISGGCWAGGDRFAEEIAKKLQIPITIYYAAWYKLGKRAGMLRNGTIAKESDILIACVALDRTGGTEDTIKKFKQFHPDGKLILC
jgi:hypothetical protein